jgi:hypothetical protein
LPAATLIFEWFVEKRGMASGIMYSGRLSSVYDS